jgi:hypothetical protein
LLTIFGLSLNFFFETNYFGILCFSQKLVLNSIITLLNKFFNFTGRKRSIKDLFSLILGLIVFAHFFGCFWHFLAIFEIEYLKRNDTWLHSTEIIENNSWI